MADGLMADLNPPHWYITKAEMQRALFTYIGMTEHPRLANVDGGIPPIDRCLIRGDISPSDAVDLAPPLANSASLAAPASPTLPAAVPIPSSAEDAPAAENLPESPSGHLVSVLMFFNSQVAGPVGRGSKLVTKKSKVTKSGDIVLEGISRTSFITAFLSVHGLSDQYSPGVHSGPANKFFWTGSVGGKTGANTIENDHEFSVALGALLKKNRQTCQVGVEFDVNDMEGFRIRNRPILISDVNQDGDEELLFGTQVPRVQAFQESAQLQGAIILELKKKWPCAQHQGENGDSVYCYISPNADHVGLNNRKLKIWAAAIAAADATKHEPLSTVEFDGIRDGRLVVNKPRGRTVAVAPANDASTLLMAAIIPLLTTLSQKRPRFPSPPRRYLVPLLPSTPRRSNLGPSTPFTTSSMRLRASNMPE